MAREFSWDYDAGFLNVAETLPLGFQSAFLTNSFPVGSTFTRLMGGVGLSATQFAFESEGLEPVELAAEITINFGVEGDFGFSNLIWNDFFTVSPGMMVRPTFQAIEGRFNSVFGMSRRVDSEFQRIKASAAQGMRIGINFHFPDQFIINRWRITLHWSLRSLYLLP